MLAEHHGDDVELLVNALGIGLGEDGADRGGGDHLGVALRHHSEDVAHEVHSAPLPGSAEEYRPIAAFKPVWASLMTSWTPLSPRAFSPRRNAVQNAPS